MNYKSVFKDLIKGKTHEPPCTCAACLYPRYLKGSQKRAGREFSPSTFFVFWLIIEIKKQYAAAQAKEDPAFRLTREPTMFWCNGKVIFAADYKVFINAPFQEELKKILRRIVRGEKNATLFWPDIDTYFQYLMKDYLRRWENNRSFIGILNHVEREIHNEAREQATAQDLKDFSLGLKIKDFIKARKQASRSALLRRYSKNTAEDIRRAIETLEDHTTYRIVERKEGKRTLFSISEHCDRL